jgi:phosphatidylinositol alpha-mannosyltransferase
MRIGLVCPYSLTRPGGVQGQVLGLARALRALGHPTRVLAPCDGPPPDEDVTPLGASLPMSANGSVVPLAPDPAAQLRTIRALRDERFDVVHLHEPLAPGVTMTALLVSTSPNVGTFHAAWDNDPYRWVRPIARWMVDHLDLRVAVSEDARRTAITGVGGEYHVLFNGVDVARFAEATPTPSDGPTIFFVGRHEERKGLSVLLDAFEALPPTTRLWIAGEGPDTEELRRRHPDARISWLGRIGDAEVAARMAGASVFCAPSTGGESFGIVLLEAMAAGTPVVASDLVGYRHVARDGADAMLVPPGDASALASALGSIIGEPGRAAVLVAGGRERAAELSMARLARCYEELYRTLIDKPVPAARGRRRRNG